jgi:tRNA(adenine34) deaminase
VKDRAGTHEEFMRHCIQLARHAKAQGNTAVGCVVVFGDKIVGEGVEQLPAGNILTGHAEVLACQQAIETLQVRSLEKAILYSTAEPCFMCSYVIRQCRIAKVVYGTKTAMIGGITSSFPILTALDLNAWRSAPQVIGGILAEECRRLHSH